jgi:TP901 family phage tail tape measure protein
MDAGVIEGALVMRDLATATLARVEQSLAQFDAKYKAVADSAKRSGETIDDSAMQVEKSFTRNMKAAGDSMVGIGRNLSMFVTAPLTAAAVGITAFASKFQSEMTKVETLAGVNRKMVKGWEQDIMNMAGAMGKAPAELAHGMLVVTSAGERGANAMSILTESAKASAIGLGDTGTVARAVTAAMQAYGAKNLDAAKAVRTLVATVVEGNVEADELAGTLGRVIGIASQVGVSFQEVGAFMATFTRLGVDAAEATTALRGMLGTLMNPSQDAREQLMALGLSIDQLRINVKEKGLTEAMIDLAGRVGDNVDAIGDIIPNIRALSGFMGTAGAQGEQFAQIIGNINAAANDANYTNEKFARTTENFGFKWDALVAKLKVAGTELGTRLMPVIEGVMEKAEPLVKWIGDMAVAFGKLPQPVQNAAFAIGAFVAVLGPLTFLLGKLALVATGGLGLSGLASGAKVVQGALQTLGNTVPVLTARLWLMDAAAKGGGGLAGLMRGLASLPVAFAGATAAAAALGIGIAFWVQQRETKKALDQLQKDIDDFRKRQTPEGRAELAAESLIDPKARAQAVELAAGVKRVTDEGKALQQVGAPLALSPELLALGAKAKSAGDSLKSVGAISAAVAQKFANTTPLVQGMGVALTQATSTARGDGIKTYSEQLAQAEATIKSFTAAQRADIEAGLKMGASASDIAGKLKVAEGVIELYKQKMTESASATKAAESQMTSLSKKATEMTTMFTGLSSLADGGSALTLWLDDNA